MLRPVFPDAGTRRTSHDPVKLRSRRYSPDGRRSSVRAFETRHCRLSGRSSSFSRAGVSLPGQSAFPHSFLPRIRGVFIEDLVYEARADGVFARLALAGAGVGAGVAFVGPRSSRSGPGNRFRSARCGNTCGRSGPAQSRDRSDIPDGYQLRGILRVPCRSRRYLRLDGQI